MGKDRTINRWELVTCALAGHVTYAPDEEPLAAASAAPPAWVRCGAACAAASTHWASRTDTATPITRR